MNLMFWWTHWFWITAIIISYISATPVPLSSFETISTSLKSALVQNNNAFQQTNDQQKLPAGSKSVPLTFETSDSDDVFGGASEIDSENAAKNKDWLGGKLSEAIKPVHVKLEKNENVPANDGALLTLPNFVNSTSNSTNVATTVLSSVTEPNESGRFAIVFYSNFMQRLINFHFSNEMSTAMQRTKLIKIEEVPSDEHILSVKSLDLTNSDVTEPSPNDSNDTVEIVMTEESNVTDVAELSERKSKGLLGYSEEAKIVNNISSRSALQVNRNEPTPDERLSSEALFDTDEDNGGITMSAGIISLMCVGIIGSLSAFSIMFVYVYRRRFLNKPQTLSEPDSSGYIDESSIRVSCCVFKAFEDINSISFPGQLR